MYNDYETLIYGEDGENPLKPTVVRCLREAKDAGSRLKVEIRVQHAGTTSSKTEHTFVVDSEEEHADVVIAEVKERLEANPGEGFEGQIRLNFYSAQTTGVKYGSFTRTVRQRPPTESFPDMGGGMNMPNMMGGMPNMMNMMQQQQGGGYDDFNLGGLGRFDDNEDEEDSDDDDRGSRRSGSQNNMDFAQMQQMMTMMQSMMQMQSGNQQPSNAVDQQMSKDWLNHTMSFLFRALALNMSMFEKSTKMMEIYAMRFGLPQPLERPAPERIIREVPMEMEFPQYQAPPVQQQAEKPSLLPQLLQAAAAFAGNPQAGALMQTVATMMTPEPAPAPPPPPPQGKIRMKPKQQSRPSGNQNQSRPKYIKQEPPKPAKPVDGADEFEWSEQSSPGGFDGGDDFMGGMDSFNSSSFDTGGNGLFADLEEDSGGFDDENFNYGDSDEEYSDDESESPDFTTHPTAGEDMQAMIKAWANKPENKERAKALGMRLFQHQSNPEAIRDLPSLGDFEDKAQEWAIANPMKAKMLMLSLASVIM